MVFGNDICSLMSQTLIISHQLWLAVDVKRKCHRLRLTNRLDIQRIWARVVASAPGRRDPSAAGQIRSGADDLAGIASRGASAALRCPWGGGCCHLC